MHRALLFILIFTLFSCGSKPKVEDEKIVYPGMPMHSVDELAKLIFEQGDELAYQELRTTDPFFGNPERLMPYALIMANKYDSGVACFDVYYGFLSIYNTQATRDLDRLDETSQHMAVEYLQKASKRGEWQASEILGKYYMEGRYVKKDTILGRKLMGERPESLKLKKRSILYPVIQ